MSTTTTHHTQTAYKDTPIGKIPADWEVKKLGEICEIKTGDKDTQNKVDNGLYPFFVRSDKVERINSYSYDGEAILTSGDGVGVGKNFHYINGKFDFHQRVYSIRKFETTVNGKFIYYYFSEKFFERVKKLSAKNSVDSVRMEMIFDMKIPLPPLSEQKRIAEVLSTWDQAIQLTEQLIRQKEQRKKWLMQNLLTGKMRLKGFSGEWKKIGAGEVFKSVTKKGYADEELLSATQDKGMIPRTMLEGRVTMPTTGTEGFKLVEVGDFVISLRSFQGGLEYSYYRGLVSPAYTVLKPKKPISEEFYKQYFKSYDFIGHLAIAVIGIRDGKQISYDDFCTVKIPYPTIEEQTAIAEVLQTADKEIELLKAKAEQLKEQKKGLMQQLLTGRKRLNLNLQD